MTVSYISDEKPTPAQKQWLLYSAARDILLLPRECRKAAIAAHEHPEQVRVEIMRLWALRRDKRR